MSIECTRCLLSDDVPGVTLDANGLCSVCVEHDSNWGNWSQIKEGRGRELEEILEHARAAKRPYDVLVPLSGGKDSCYVLYLMRRRFRMKCLAVTFDNGFLSDHARQNIRNATERLDTDHVYYEVGRPSLMNVYRTLFLKTGMFCPACMLGIAYAIGMAATAFRIPIIAGGTSKRTEEHVSPDFFVANDIRFFEAAMEGEPVAQQVPFSRRGDWRMRYPAHFLDIKNVIRYAYGARVEIPDYMEWDYDELYRVIREELGWKAYAESAEHADCIVEPAVQYARQRKFPVLRPELLRYSKLVTNSVLTKEQARQRMGEHSQSDAPSCLATLLDALQITRDEFETVIRDPYRHKPFLDKANQRFNAYRLLTTLRHTVRKMANGR